MKDSHSILTLKQIKFDIEYLQKIPGLFQNIKH